MILAVVLVIAAVIALVSIVAATLTRSLQISSKAGLPAQIEPIDVQAFRNLVDPTEDEYLRRRLSARNFRMVRRERLRATAAYVRAAGRNAAVLIRFGQAALVSNTNVAEVDAARQLVDSALLLRRNAAIALVKIYIAMAWPHPGLPAALVLSGYERLNSSAMLLGRLRNPAAPVRIATTY